MFQTPAESAQQYLAESAEAYKHDAAYWGSTPLGTSWAYVYGTNRDADILGESNWQAVQKILTSEGFVEGAPEDGADWRTERAGHWAVGWVEYLAVKVLIDPDKGVEDGNLSPVFLRWLEVKDDLDSYPVLDEEDYSEREHKETISNLEWEITYRQGQGKCPQYVTAEALYSALYEDDVMPEDARDYEIDAAIEKIVKAVRAARRQKALVRRSQRAIEAAQASGQQALPV